MALTLAQAAVLSQDDLQRGVVETLIFSSDVLNRMPFMTIEGNAFAYNEEATLPGTEFRAVNAAYTESTGTFVQKTEGLVILGGDADVDRFIVQTRGNLNDQRAAQVNLKAKAVAAKFGDTFFNGSDGVDANSFNGLKTRLTGAQVIAAAANGMGFGSTDTTRQDFLDRIDALIAAVLGGPDVLYMNATILSRFRSVMRRLTIGTTTVDDFGRTVDRYNGIPLVDPGNKPDGSPILPQNEVQGTGGSIFSSIYAVRFGSAEGDRAVTGLQNGGMTVLDKGLLETKNVFRTSIEWYCGMAVFGPGAARLTGVSAT
jgi:hypothetical protein